jgi:hypothetical protein
MYVCVLETYRWSRRSHRQYQSRNQFARQWHRPSNMQESGEPQARRVVALRQPGLLDAWWDGSVDVNCRSPCRLWDVQICHPRDCRRIDSIDDRLQTHTTTTTTTTTTTVMMIGWQYTFVHIDPRSNLMFAHESVSESQCPVGILWFRFEDSSCSLFDTGPLQSTTQ